MKDEQRYQRAKERVDALKGLYEHLTTFLVVGMALFLIDLLTPGGWWFYWPLLFWGIGLTVQAVSVGMPGGPLGYRWEERKIREYMDESDRTSDSTPPAPCRSVRRIADRHPERSGR